MSDHPSVVAALEQLQNGATILDLRYTNIGEDGAKALAAALKENRSLTSLNLESNDIGSEGAKAVAAALKENRSLTSLNLERNYIGDEGAKAVGAALKENRSLTSLNLYGNKLGSDGAKAVAAALKENRTLTSLSLGKNDIGDEGGKAVVAALKVNWWLTSLGIDQFTDEMCEEVELNEDIYCAKIRRTSLEQLSRELRCIHVVNDALSLPFSVQHSLIAQGRLANRSGMLSSKEDYIAAQKVELDLLEAANVAFRATLGCLGPYILK